MRSVILLFELLWKGAMEFDPEEVVRLYGEGQYTLRTVVRRVMAKAPGERAGVTIFRDGEPSILDLARIESLAAQWGIYAPLVRRPAD